MVRSVPASLRCRNVTALPEQPRATGGLVAATLTHHRGFGATHHDLVLRDGARCTTIKFWRDRGVLCWALQPPHRRRYLAFRGAVPGGRGVVAPRWRGSARLVRASGGFRLWLRTKNGVSREFRLGPSRQVVSRLSLPTLWS